MWWWLIWGLSTAQAQPLPFDPLNPGGRPPFDRFHPGGRSSASPPSSPPTGFLPEGPSLRPEPTRPAPHYRPRPPQVILVPPRERFQYDLPGGSYQEDRGWVVPFEDPLVARRVVPAHALPPPNWSALIQPNTAWNGSLVMLPSGQTWQPYTALSNNTPIYAGLCWGVPTSAPDPTPPSYRGVVQLPQGESWVPGTILSPQTSVWAWMCGAWKWGQGL